MIITKNEKITTIVKNVLGRASANASSPASTRRERANARLPLIWTVANGSFTQPSGRRRRPHGPAHVRQSRERLLPCRRSRYPPPALLRQLGRSRSSGGGRRG